MVGRVEIDVHIKRVGFLSSCMRHEAHDINHQETDSETISVCRVCIHSTIDAFALCASSGVARSLSSTELRGAGAF